MGCGYIYIIKTRLMGQKDGSGEIKDKGEGKMGFECYIYVYIDIGKVII